MRVVLAFLCLWSAAAAHADAPVLPSLADKKALRVGMQGGGSPFVAVGAEAVDLHRRLGAGVPPLLHARDGREVAGFDVDLVREAARALDLPLEIILVDKFEDLLPGLRAGRYDVVASSLTRTLERARSVAFSDAYFATGLVAVARKPEAFATLDAANKPEIRVAFHSGTTAEAFVARELPRAKKIPLADDAALFAAADADGGADVFVVDYLLLRDAEVRGRVHRTLSLIEDRRFSVEQLAFAARQGDPDWLAWINLFLKQVRSSGTFHKLAARYNAWFRTER